MSFNADCYITFAEVFQNNIWQRLGPCEFGSNIVKQGSLSKNLCSMACVNKEFNSIVKKILAGDLPENLRLFFQSITVNDSAIVKCNIGEDKITLCFASAYSNYSNKMEVMSKKLYSNQNYKKEYNLQQKGEIAVVGCNNPLQRHGQYDDQFFNEIVYGFSLIHDKPLNGSRQIRLVYDTFKEVAKEKIHEMIKNQKI